MRIPGNNHALIPVRDEGVGLPRGTTLLGLRRAGPLFAGGKGLRRPG